jgi:hypothetical protein
VVGLRHGRPRIGRWALRRGQPWAPRFVS